MSSICFLALKNCYAVAWSYGEICVGCNCCGQFDKSKQRLARLKYWQEKLERHLNFDQWCDLAELRAIQEHNVRANIKNAKQKVRYYSKRKEG